MRTLGQSASGSSAADPVAQIINLGREAEQCGKLELDLELGHGQRKRTRAAASSVRDGVLVA